MYTYNSIPVGAVLALPVMIALYHMMAVAVAYWAKDILADYQEPVSFARPDMTILVEMHQSVMIHREYQVFDLPVRPMEYREYQVTSL